MSDTIILHEMVPKWNRLFKQKGEFRKIRWCETHHHSIDANEETCWVRSLIKAENDCRIVGKWLES